MTGVMDQSAILASEAGKLTVIDCLMGAVHCISPPWGSNIGKPLHAVLFCRIPFLRLNLRFGNAGETNGGVPNDIRMFASIY